MEEKKVFGFEITPTLQIVYSNFDPKTSKWSPLILSSWRDNTFWPSPMSAGLNYGLAVFEGMKAFRHQSGEIFLFRPKDHAERFSRSLRGLLMPEFPESEFLNALQLLALANASSVPKYRQGSLYIRPIAYGNDKLGFAFNPELSYTAAFWCTPVGNYYAEGLKPIAVYVMREVTRAMPGGVGWCKAGGNYEISRIAQFAAKQNGCQDALFLDGKTKKYIEELGAANVFMVKNSAIYTPRLGDTILPGITRKSIITLAKKELNLKVRVGNVSAEQLIEADEVFACGTAAVVTPINKLKDGGIMHTIGSGEIGEITKKLYELLTGIQYGDLEDKFGWLTKVVV